MGEYWEEHGGLGKLVLEVTFDRLPSAMIGLWRSINLPAAATVAGVDEGWSTAVEAWEAQKKSMVFMMRLLCVCVCLDKMVFLVFPFISHTEKCELQYVWFRKREESGCCFCKETHYIYTHTES